MIRFSCLLLVPFLATRAETGASIEAVTGWGVDFAVPRSHHPADGLDGLVASDRSTGPIFGLGAEAGWTSPNEIHLGLAANYLVRTTSWDREGNQVVQSNATDSVNYKLQEDGSETFQFLGADPCVALLARKWVGFRILAEFGGVYGTFRDHWESRDSGRGTPTQFSDRSGSRWVPGYLIGMDLDKPIHRGAGFRLGLRYASLLGTLSNGTDAWSASSRSWQRMDVVVAGYIGF